MIGLFDDDHTTRLAVTFGGLNLNSLTVNSAGTKSSRYGYTVETATMRTAMDYISEPHQWNDMMELYGLRKNSRLLVLRGFVYARNISELYDKMKALGAATDPARIKFQNPTSWTEMPLTFSTPTEDTSNFGSGLAPSKYLVLPIRMAEPIVSVAGAGLAAPYEIDFLMREPKRFLQSATTLSGNGTITNTIADDRSWPTITFTLSGGAGSSSFTIQNVATYQGTLSLVLDLSAYSTGNWTINFRDQLIYQGTTLRPDVYKSGSWWCVEPGSNAITYTNTTNTSSRSLSFYPAFSL